VPVTMTKRYDDCYDSGTGEFITDYSFIFARGYAKGLEESYN